MQWGPDNPGLPSPQWVLITLVYPQCNGALLTSVYPQRSRALIILVYIQRSGAQITSVYPQRSGAQIISVYLQSFIAIAIRTPIPDTTNYLRTPRTASRFQHYFQFLSQSKKWKFHSVVLSYIKYFSYARVLSSTLAHGNNRSNETILLLLQFVFDV